MSFGSVGPRGSTASGHYVAYARDRHNRWYFGKTKTSYYWQLPQYVFLLHFVHFRVMFHFFSMNSSCFGLLQSLPNQWNQCISSISSVYHRIDLCVKHQPHLDQSLLRFHDFMTLHPRFHIDDETARQVDWMDVEELGASEFCDSIHSVHLSCRNIILSYHHISIFFNLLNVITFLFSGKVNMFRFFSTWPRHLWIWPSP